MLFKKTIKRGYRPVPQKKHEPLNLEGRNQEVTRRNVKNAQKEQLKRKREREEREKKRLEKVNRKIIITEDKGNVGSLDKFEFTRKRKEEIKERGYYA